MAGLNEALWAKAAGEKLLRTARVRADTTVIAANVAYPTDSGLLAKAVGKLVRTVRRVQAAGGATGTVMTDRRRAAARRVREIASKLRTRGKLGREESTQAIRRVTGELADLAEKTAARGRRGAAQRPPRGAEGAQRAGARPAAAGAGRAGGHHRAHRRDRGPDPDPAGRADAGKRDPAGQPARSRRPADPQGPHRPAGRVRVQGPGHRQRRRHHPGLQRRIRRRPRRAATGARRRSGSAAAPAACPARSPPTAATASPPSSATCRPGRADRRDPPPGHHLTRPQGDRAQPRLPPAGQMAHRLAKGGSATSNAATAGTAPAWTAGTEPRSGAGTEYSPTTWSRSAPWPADQPSKASSALTSRPPRIAAQLRPKTFSGRSS